MRGGYRYLEDDRVGITIFSLRERVRNEEMQGEVNKGGRDEISLPTCVFRLSFSVRLFLARRQRQSLVT